MSVYQIIELLFSSEQGSINQESLIEKLSVKTGNSVESIEQAHKGCRDKRTKGDFIRCIRKKLGLGGPGLR